MQAIRTYFVLALSDVRSQMQYRASDLSLIHI